MRLARSVLLSAALLAACGLPKDPEGWAKRAASRSRIDEKLEALREARKAPGDRKAAVPALCEVLKQAPKARAEAAVLLGEIGDPAAIGPLGEAVDLAARDRETAEANRQIAGALGALRARAAVPVLEKLTGSPDGYTQVAAVDALGQIGDGAAVDTLVAVATGELVEPFTRKKALLALGRIGDARAAPSVLRMLFEERPGVSFFPEASFAAVQLGRPMAAPLLAVVEGKDATLSAWARERGVLPGALVAKAAQLLGDVGGPEAVPALVARLGYQDPEPTLTLFVRVFAAESLGRLRAREAVKPIAERLAREDDPAARVRYAEALSRIGDPAALPALRAAAAGSKSWDQKLGPLEGLSRLGGAAEAAEIEAEATRCGAGCPREQAEALAAMQARLAAAAACRELTCWTGKLADQSPAGRDRAALEVGRAGGAAQGPALVDAIVRPVDDLAGVSARYHAVLALGWIAGAGALGDAGPLADKLDQMIAADRGRTLTAAVNEDALRLATRLRRAAAR